MSGTDEKTNRVTLKSNSHFCSCILMNLQVLTSRNLKSNSHQNLPYAALRHAD